MAKKNRKNLVDIVTQENIEETAVEIPVNEVAAETVSETDDHARIEEEAVKVSEKNNELEDKLAEYIAKVEQLEAENKQLKQLNAKLQEDADTYLINISKLTFDNAVLQSSVDNLKQESSSELHADSQPVSKPQNSQKSIQTTSTSVRYSSLNDRYKKNGYSDWN